MSLGTLFITATGVCCGYALKSKCYNVNICFGCLEIERDIDAEVDVEMAHPQQQFPAQEQTTASSSSSSSAADQILAEQTTASSSSSSAAADQIPAVSATTAAVAHNTTRRRSYNLTEVARARTADLVKSSK